MILIKGEAMKIKLYKHKLENEALIVLNSNFDILEINELASKYLDYDSTIDQNFFKVLEQKTGVSNIKELILHSLNSHIEIKAETIDNKNLYIKSLILHERLIISIFISSHRNSSINSLIEAYIKSENEALIYFDEINDELFVTEKFLSLFDLKKSDLSNYRVFLLKILKQIRDNSPIISLLKNTFRRHEEFLGIFELFDNQKIEYIYKRFEFDKDVKGILCNFIAVDREIRRITYDYSGELLEKKLMLEEMEFLISNSPKDSKSILLAIDLIAFKKVNEIYGIKMGNYVLKSISKKLQQIIRKNDLVLRYSADKFLLLINDYKDLTFLDRFIHKILEKISSPITLNNRTVYISAIVGAANCEKDLSLDIILKNSFAALYHAKESELNFCIYNDQLERKIAKKNKLEIELREAVKNEDFSVFYQPQVSIKTGDICAVEALARWKNKEGIYISPSIFIPLAEEIDVIKDIDKIILRKAFSEAEDFLKSKKIKLALNLSIKQFLDKEYIEFLRQYDNLYEFLEIEITENAALNNLKNSIEIIKEYKNLGVKIAIDDFGVGYSSLSHVKDLPIDKIKIDKSFIDNIVSSKGDKTLVQAVILIAQTFNLEVIAEGVEFEEQWNTLKDLGVELFQGFYFDQPMPLDDLKKNIEKNSYKLK